MGRIFHKNIRHIHKEEKLNTFMNMNKKQYGMHTDEKCEFGGDTFNRKWYLNVDLSGSSHISRGSSPYTRSLVQS
jgi:hypothetical protein